MSNQNGHNGTLFGTIGGTLLSVSASIHLDDVFKTVALGAIGAITSYLVSVAMRCASKAIKNKKNLRS